MSSLPGACAACDLVPCGYCQEGCLASSCTYESSIDKPGSTTRNDCAEASGVKNSGLVPPICKPTVCVVGLQTPATQGLHVNNVTFAHYSLNTTHAVRATAGGYEVTFSNISWEDSTSRVGWTDQHESVFVDVDGSFSEHGSAASVVPYNGLLDGFGCFSDDRYGSMAHAGYVCPGAVMRRIRIAQPVPSTLQDSSLKLSYTAPANAFVDPADAEYLRGKFRPLKSDGKAEDYLITLSVVNRKVTTISNTSEFLHTRPWDSGQGQVIGGRTYTCVEGYTPNWNSEYSLGRGSGVGQLLFEEGGSGVYPTDEPLTAAQISQVGCMAQCEVLGAAAFNWQTLCSASHNLPCSPSAVGACRCYAAAALTFTPTSSGWRFCTAQVPESRRASAGCVAAPECVFPFDYEGKTYPACTTVGNGGTGNSACWCATASVLEEGSHEWKYCSGSHEGASIHHANRRLESGGEISSDRSFQVDFLQGGQNVSRIGVPKKSYTCVAGYSPNWDNEDREARGSQAGQVLHAESETSISKDACKAKCEGLKAAAYNWHGTYGCRCYPAASLTFTPTGAIGGRLESDWNFCTPSNSTHLVWSGDGTDLSSWINCSSLPGECTVQKAPAYTTNVAPVAGAYTVTVPVAASHIPLSFAECIFL